jgi:adenosyl cobinamide kinase/adenosyl cobinamide phosphate guanylyltransferase
MVNTDKLGFFNSILQPGMLLNILGKMGEGKSNYATVLIERAVEKYYYILTNILFFDDDEIDEAKKEGLLDKNIEYRKLPQEVKQITKMSDLLIELNKVSRKKKTIVVLDEASLFASGVIAREKRVIWLKNFVTSFLRKIGGSLILIAQDKNSVVPMLRDELPSTEIRITYNKKTKIRTEHIFIIPDEYGITQEPIHLESRIGIPQATFPYDSNAPAKFEFDIDFDDFMNMAGEFNSLKLRKQLPHIIHILRENQMQKTKTQLAKQITKKDLLSLMIKRDPEMPVSSIKDILHTYFGVSVTPDYVSKVKKEILTYEIDF